MVFLAAGHIEKAEKAFNNALRLSPEIADIKNQLEVIRARRADH